MLMLCGVHLKPVAASLHACKCLQRPSERHNYLGLNLFEFSSVLVRIEAAQESSRILDQYSGLVILVGQDWLGNARRYLEQVLKQVDLVRSITSNRSDIYKVLL